MWKAVKNGKKWREKNGQQGQKRSKPVNMVKIVFLFFLFFLIKTVNNGKKWSNMVKTGKIYPLEVQILDFLFWIKFYGQLKQGPSGTKPWPGSQFEQ